MDFDKYRTGLKRVWAFLVDWVVFLPLLFIDRWLSIKIPSNVEIFGWKVLSFALPIIYRFLMHYFGGQTIGKWVVGIKVLNFSESNKLTLKQCFLRDIFYWFLLILTALDSASLIYAGSLNLLEAILDWDDFISLCWFLLSIIVMLLTPIRRTIHDYIANTVVVRVESITTLTK
jgi:uncharacterized RDD family membrane protein YckC